MRKNEISFLRELNQAQWIEFIERVLMYKSLPIINPKNTANEYLIFLNNELVHNKEIDIVALFHKSLMQYYFNLFPDNINSESIYNLHYVFSAIKPKISLVERLELQLTSNSLKKQFYEGISLHSSLLALLIDLEIVNKDRIRHYLNQCEYSDYDLHSFVSA